MNSSTVCDRIWRFKYYNQNSTKMLIHHNTIQPFTRKARRRSLVSQTKTLFIEKPWLNVLFFVISVFLGGKVKFGSKTAREVHGNGQDTAWSQSSNQTPRNKKWGITIQNVKYLVYCNPCMNLFPLLSNCLNSLIPTTVPHHLSPPPPSSFVGMGENPSWCIVKHLLSLLSVTWFFEWDMNGTSANYFFVKSLAAILDFKSSTR